MSRYHQNGTAKTVDERKKEVERKLLTIALKDAGRLTEMSGYGIDNLDALHQPLAYAALWAADSGASELTEPTFKQWMKTQHYGKQDIIGQLHLCAQVASDYVDANDWFDLLSEWQDAIGRIGGKDALNEYAEHTKRHGSDLESIHRLLTKMEGAGHRAEAINAILSTESYEPSDNGNARMFADIYGCDIRYIHEWKRWLVWNGKRWVDDTEGLLHRKVDHFIRQTMAEYCGNINDHRKREDYFKHIAKSQNKYRIDGMLALAAEKLKISVNRLDADPWLFNVQNGTVDLTTGEIREHRRDDLLTKMADIKYDQTAECPTWRTFLHRIFADPSTGEPRHDLIRFMQRSAGYALTGSVESQCFWILHGSGANGKTTFINALLHILGDYGLQGQQSLLLSDRNSQKSNSEDEASLFGVRFATCSETEQRQRLNEAKIKRLTGGNRIAAMRKYEHQITFDATHKIWMDCNHRPTMRGDDYAMRRRIMLVPFEVRIPQGEQDGQLQKKLEAEASGILNWMLEGLKAWRHDGLNPPNIVMDAVNAYACENDVLGQFLAEYTQDNDAGRIAQSDIYAKYKMWAEDNGLSHPLTKPRLFQELQERGYGKAKIKGVRVIKGIEWQDEDDKPAASFDASDDEYSFA